MPASVAASILRHRYSPTQAVVRGSEMPLLVACSTQQEVRVAATSSPETPRPTRYFVLLQMILGIHQSRPAPAPRPRGPAFRAPRAPIRIFAVFPVRTSGIRRTSRRLGLKTGNGRRQLVFSFIFGQTAFSFDSRYCFPE